MDAALGKSSSAAFSTRLRAVRRARWRDELIFVALAAIVGILSGAAAVGISSGAKWMHRVLFDAGADGMLSPLPVLSSSYMYFIPALGGLALGLLGLFIKRWRPRPMVDPIEANALHGGRMSLLDSAILSLQVMLCNGFGASVGMEAGYTQAGSGMASAIAARFHLSRSQWRVLVGCGAAGGIAAAFHAPLTGAFYGFELIIGVYAIPAVAPVMTAALLAFLTARALGATPFPIVVPPLPDLTAADYPPFILLGLMGAAVAIAIMRLVTLVERGFASSGVPVPLRPAIGGLGVGALALYSPQILSSGEGALHIQVGTAVTLSVLFVFLLKICASSLSLGSGFRGGLFLAALFLGSMMGKLFAGGASFLGLEVDPVVSAVVGMAALAVGIVGGPFTMTFLTLETTGDLAISGLVLTAAIACSLTVRETFGYSFSTWRLHLRGESIRGAHDVGWLRELTVERLMEQGLSTFPASGTQGALRAAFPLGQVRYVALLDGEGRYAGMVRVARVYSAGLDGPIADFAQHRNDVLHPQMNVTHAQAVFRHADAELLAVVDPASGRVLGQLHEVEALRRYAQEVEAARRDLSGGE
ncbi:chloride channel protein [Roseixanthobacter pseudopolyaromaticivorans]|uniref:chloride channel protein n=1 Tax=Xanthobacteraceae TaxID=335928 RepID=UPI0037262AB7